MKYLRCKSLICVFLFGLFVPLSFSNYGFAIAPVVTSDLEKPDTGTFSGQLSIPASEYYVYNHTWNESQRVYITYSGVSGGNKDVIVHVVDSDNFAKFKKDFGFNTIRSYPKMALNRFEFDAAVNITYYIIFTNQFSVLSDKVIQIQIDWIPLRILSMYQEHSTFQLSPNTRMLMEFVYFTNTSISLDIAQGGAQGANTMDIYIVDIDNLQRYLQNLSFSPVFRRLGYTLIDEKFNLDSAGLYFLIIQASDSNSLNLTIALDMNFPSREASVSDLWVGTIPIVLGIIAIFAVLIIYIIRNKQTIGKNSSYQKKYQALSKSSLVSNSNEIKPNVTNESNRFESRDSGDNEPKFCPFCGSEISLTLKICPFCKTKLE